MEDQKHPIILDGKHKAIQLLLEPEHRENSHELMENVCVVQQKLWVIGLRNVLRSIKYHCVRDRKRNIIAHQPIMSDLPPERVSHGVCAFESTGVD